MNSKELAPVGEQTPLVSSIPPAKNHCTRATWTVFLNGVRHTIAIIAETTEGAAFGYALYLTIGNDPDSRTPLGYIPVGICATLNGVLEILHRAGCIYNFHSIHRIKKSLITGLMGGAFVADKIQNVPASIATNVLVSTAIASSHLAIQIADDRGAINTNFRKALKFGVRGIAATLVTLHFVDELIEIPEGFEVEINIGFRIAAYIALCAIFVPAHLFNYRGAKLLRSILYGGAVAEFAMILAFDLVTEILQSDDFSNGIFAAVMVITLLQGIGSSIVYYNEEEEPSAAHAHAPTAVPAIEDDKPKSPSFNQHRVSFTQAPAAEAPAAYTGEAVEAVTPQDFDGPEHEQDGKDPSAKVKTV